MSLLLVNQFFRSDDASTGRLLDDLSAAAAVLTSVTVLCSASQRIDVPARLEDPVTVIRIPSGTFNRATLHRAWSFLRFLSIAIVTALHRDAPDVVLTLTTPPLLPLLGTLLKRLRGSRHYIWEMDLYPEVATDLRVLRKSSALAWLAGVLMDFSRRNADGVIALGECMRDRLVARGIPACKIHVAENWADGNVIYPLSRCANKRFTVLYSGNLGLAHDIDTVSAAIHRMRSLDTFQFVFAGGGARRSAFQEFCRGRNIDSVEFRPYCTDAGLAASLNSGDVGLVTQQSACAGSVVPSKVYGLMAAGRPYIFVGPPTATPNVLIQRFGCGWHIENGDVDGLISLLKSLHANPGLVWAAGRNARTAFVEHYTAPAGVARICKILGVA
jgi:colanic acid biosynthesis glycosyl transferase WcaI